MKKFLIGLFILLTFTGCSLYVRYDNPNPMDLRDNLKGWRLVRLEDKFNEPTNKVVAFYPLSGGNGEAGLVFSRELYTRYTVLVNMGEYVGSNISNVNFIIPKKTYGTSNVYNGKGNKIGQVDSVSTSLNNVARTVVYASVRFIFPDGKVYDVNAIDIGNNTYSCIGIELFLMTKFKTNPYVDLKVVGTTGKVYSHRIDLQDFEKAYQRIGYFPKGNTEVPKDVVNKTKKTEEQPKKWEKW